MMYLSLYKYIYIYIHIYIYIYIHMWAASVSVRARGDPVLLRGQARPLGGVRDKHLAANTCNTVHVIMFSPTIGYVISETTT